MHLFDSAWLYATVDPAGATTSSCVRMELLAGGMPAI